MDNKNDVKFIYNNGFRETCESMLKTYDHSLNELRNVVTGKTVAPDEYAVCNREYKFRYISPNNIAEYASLLIRVLFNHLISVNVTDIEKFSVECACRFVGENDCDGFKWDNIYEDSGYTRHDIGLRELIVYCQNEFFSNIVVSKYEMDERRNHIKKDYDKINGIHLSANIRRMIDAIPRLMEKTDFVNLGDDERLVITTFIENFIMFAINLTLSSVVSMIMYCVPRSTYNTALRHHDLKVDNNSLLDDEYFKESVDESTHKPVYVIFTDTKSIVANPIKKVTKSDFNHASFAFDPSFETVYTFNRKGDSGFTIEDFSTNLFQQMDCSVFVAFVSDSDYRKMKKYVNYIEKNQMFTKYDWGVVRAMLFNKDTESSDFRGVCSTFVNNIFKVIGKNYTDKDSPNQEELRSSINTNKDQFNEIYNGPVADMTKDSIVEKTHDFAKYKKSHSISEYVTECCLLKTNNIVFNNKLPFNINMRNIVLQDMHPNFKDTVTAVRFIMNDSRSPVNQMIIKYGSYDIGNKINPDMIVRMFIGQPCSTFDNFSNYQNFYNDTDFHSDVNWLDRITFGDPYQDGNYRTDAVGNDHKHPVVMTLRTLYQMYGDHLCKTNQDLADNIERVGNAMIGIAQVYKDCGIRNWELVRDILAVFGEIMTKCIIRLYNNHMTVIVASDNMDDTMIPGYMYEEYFVEDGESGKPTVTVANANSASNQGKSTGKQILAKGKEFLKQMVHKFSGWVTDGLAKVPQKFVDAHKAELDWVSKHSDLNNKIAASIGNDFNPHVENWPLYKIPIQDIKAAANKIPTIVTELKNSNDPVDMTSVKNKFYSKIGQDSGLSNIEVSGHEGSKENKNMTAEEKAVTNWILYSNVNPTNTTTNQLTSDNWTDLIKNISESPKAVKEAIDAISNGFKKAAEDIDKEIKTITDAKPVQEYAYDGDISEYDYYVEMENADKNNQTPPAAEEQKSGNTSAKPNAPQDGDAKVKKLTTIFNGLTDLSKVFGSSVAKVLNEKFYRTCYNLYRDMVTAYQQSNGKFTDQQTETNNAEQNNAETPKTEAGTDQANAGANTNQTGDQG